VLSPFHICAAVSFFRDQKRERDLKIKPFTGERGGEERRSGRGEGVLLVLQSSRGQQGCSEVAQWERAGLITLRSSDRN
jgi:hypothetical protein